MELKGKVIVITGGGKGLGQQMASRLANKSTHLALIDNDEEKLQHSEEICKAEGAPTSVWQCDVSKEDEVEETFRAIAQRHGRLDGIINNAGITNDALFLKVKRGHIENRMSLESWQKVIDVNLTGVFLCARAAATEMIKAGNGGCIINISSISRHGNIGQTNYSASKAGVAAMTVIWAKELAEQNIRCAAIAPGYIGTEMVMSMKDDYRQNILSGIPVKRFGQPDEIAHTVEFILTNDYINGRIIEVDGGLRI